MDTKLDAMPGTKPMDWSSVDWSQQNRDIAEQFQISSGKVSLMRKRLRKPRPKHWHKQKTFPARLERWSHVDWRQTNTAIGRKMNVSGEWARQVRLMLGKPKATIKALDPKVISGLERIKACLDQLRECSVTQAAAILGMKLAPSTRARRFLDEQAVLRDGLRKHPWHAMNFELGNTALARIWGIRRDVIATRRFRHRLGPPKWSGVSYDSHCVNTTDAQYRRALVTERKKTRTFRHSGSTSQSSVGLPSRFSGWQSRSEPLLLRP